MEKISKLASEVTALGNGPHQRGDSLSDHAVRYAEECHWDVLPGTWLETAGGEQHCSCGATGCPRPGAHPPTRDWPSRATGSATTVRRLWSEEPRASVLLPTGRSFDALDVPEAAGCLALARLERLELPIGPVVAAPAGRMLFFVLPGAAAKTPDQLRRLGRPPGTIDLTVRGDGDYVEAPPTRSGRRGISRWARPPSAANRWLPDAPEMIPALVYACGR